MEEIPVDIMAYVGDAYFNFFCVLYSIGDGRKEVSKANHLSSFWKSAQGQDVLLSKVSAIFSSEELEITKRGKNSKGAKKRGNDIQYRNSTGFETLIGYLYLKGDQARLHTIFQIVEEIFKNT